MTVPGADGLGTSGGVWQLCGPLQWRLYEDGCVVYSARQLKLHRLDPLPAAVLSLLEEQPLTEDRLLGQITQATGQPAASATGPAVRAALQELQQSGLVKPAPP